LAVARHLPHGRHQAGTATSSSTKSGTTSLALTAAPATEGRWGLGYGLGLLPGGDRLAYHEGANRGWRAGLALLPDRQAGIVVLANGDAGSGPIDAVVQQWLALATPNPKHTRLRTAVLAILAVAAAAALGLAKRRRTQKKRGDRQRRGSRMGSLPRISTSSWGLRLSWPGP
jgi:hypothetical protein